MKQEYKSSIRSKKMIRQAVVTLLEKKSDLNKITVTDVVTEADINRGTFYNHYNNINDVVNEIEDEMMSQLNAIMENAIKNDNSIANIMYTIRDYFRDNREFYRTITPLIPQYILNDMKNKIYTEIQNRYEADKSIEKRVEHLVLANGLSGLLVDFLKGEVDIDIDSLTEASIKAIEKLLGYSVK